MPRFVVDKPILTAGPRIVVEGGLEAGRHRFQLEVITADGRRSAPMLFSVELRKPLSPDATRPTGRVPRDVPPVDAPAVDVRPVEPRLPARLRLDAPTPARPVLPGAALPSPVPAGPTPTGPTPAPSTSVRLEPARPEPVRPAPKRPAPAAAQPARIAPATSGRPQRTIRRPGRGDHNPTE